MVSTTLDQRMGRPVLHGHSGFDVVVVDGIAGEVDEVARRLRAAGSVYAEDEAALLCAAPVSHAALEAMVARRVAGAPLEHVLGWAEFCGQRILLDDGVFVPRRRTEALARAAVERLVAVARRSPVAVDLCCGSGAIGAVLLAHRPDTTLYASDIDPAAVRCARRNLPEAREVCADLFDGLPAALRGRIDVLVANLPYVPTGDLPTLPAEAREHERRIALDGGADGLAPLRRLATDARSWLGPDGTLLVEVADAQVPAARTIVARAGLHPQLLPDDERGCVVLLGARRPPVTTGV